MSWIFYGKAVCCLFVLSGRKTVVSDCFFRVEKGKGKTRIGRHPTRIKKRRNGIDKTDRLV